MRQNLTEADIAAMPFSEEYRLTKQIIKDMNKKYQNDSEYKRKQKLIEQRVAAAWLQADGSRYRKNLIHKNQYTNRGDTQVSTWVSPLLVINNYLGRIRNLKS